MFSIPVEEKGSDDPDDEPELEAIVVVLDKILPAVEARAARYWAAADAVEAMLVTCP